jgi:hypothetical protein
MDASMEMTEADKAPIEAASMEMEADMALIEKASMPLRIVLKQVTGAIFQSGRVMIQDAMTLFRYLTVILKTKGFILGECH